MSFQIIQGTTGLVDPNAAILDNGWTVDGVYAIHMPCNDGPIVSLQNFGLVIGRQYTFEYIVDQYVSGGVKIIAGTQGGTVRTAAGTYTETLTQTGNTTVSFLSSGGGSFRIQILKFYDTLLGPQPGRTITFNERENKWVQEWSWQSEMMVKFITKLFSFNNGNLWLHNDNQVMNTFYGVKYPAQVIMIVNQDYEKSKLWFNMRLDSTGKWYVPNITIAPDDLFPNGMQTLMSSANIKSIDGKLWADILRDITDPNFAGIADPGLRTASALFRGRMMQGGWLIVLLQNDDTTLATLSSAEFFYIDVQKTLKP